MPLVVQKYGGTSVATPELICSVARRVVEAKGEWGSVIVVVSAMGDATDELLSLARRVSPKPNPRELDMLMTVGERISMALLSMAIRDLGFEAISFTGSQCGIVTDGTHTNARIVDIKGDRIREALDANQIVIVAGFQGVSQSREITTLGRGGSDTTAVALAVALKADRCEILKDVEGVCTADPRRVRGARKIDFCSYDEMLALSRGGAAVLHPRAVDLARRFEVPLVVGSSFTRDVGTVIGPKKEIMESISIRGITDNPSVTKVTVSSIPESVRVTPQILTPLFQAGLSLHSVAKIPTENGTMSLLFLMGSEERSQVSTLLLPIVKSWGGGSHSIQIKDVASLSIVGEGISNTAEVSLRAVEILSSSGIDVEMVTPSPFALTYIIESRDINRALEALHEGFQLGKQESHSALEKLT